MVELKWWVLRNDENVDIQSVLSQFEIATRRDSVSHGERQRVVGCPTWAASHRVAKKKLWVNIGSLSPYPHVSVCLRRSLTHLLKI